MLVIMRTTSEYIHLLKQFKASYAETYGIKKLGLFGSAARGELHEGSDVDVVYEGEPNILLRSRMKTQLEALFGCRVDVVRYRKQMADTAFGKSIREDLIMV
jgi:predicted nucleotidyltransferase